MQDAPRRGHRAAPSASAVAALILHHGWADRFIAPGFSIDFHRAIIRDQARCHSRPPEAALRQVQDFAFTRPLCTHPQRAGYAGQGGANDAGSLRWVPDRSPNASLSRDVACALHARDGRQDIGEG